MLSEKKLANNLGKTRYENEEILEQLRDSNTRLDNQLAEFKDNLKVVESGQQRATLLAKPRDLVNHNDVTVTRLLSKRFAGPFNDSNYRRSIYDLQVALLSLSVLLVVISSGWLLISNTNLLANGDFVYNAGLLGGFLMLCSIFYALLKRVRFINKLGHNETWYYAHLFCGVVGPLLIIFHTSFHIKSVNSAVAFFSMLIIMISGMFGRYISTLMSYQAHRTYLAISDIELQLISSLLDHRQGTPKRSKDALRRLMVNGLKRPHYWFQNIPLMLKTFYSTLLCYFTFCRERRKIFRSIGGQKNWDRKTLRAAIRHSKRLTRRYVINIAKLSLLNMVQNLLLNWRVLHANLLYLLALTAVAHIIAVHMY